MQVGGGSIAAGRAASCRARSSWVARAALAQTSQPHCTACTPGNIPGRFSKTSPSLQNAQADTALVGVKNSK